MKITYSKRNTLNLIILFTLGILGFTSMGLYITVFTRLSLQSHISMLLAIISCWAGFFTNLHTVSPEIEKKEEIRLLDEIKKEIKKSKKKKESKRIIEKSSEDFSLYLKSRLQNSKISNKCYKEFDKAITLFRTGFHQYSIIHTALILEELIDKKLTGKIAKSKLSKMKLIDKIDILQNKGMIGKIDKIKLDMVRSCRNISAHELSSKELEEVFDTARSLIDFSIGLCERLS